MDIELLNNLSGMILDSAIEVHKTLGPGLLEIAYELCLMKELTNRGLSVRNQVELPIIYKDELIDHIFKIDILVEDEIIIELKTVESLLPIHKAQLMTYMKLAKKKIGLLINFNVPLLKDGFQRVII